jgi:NAD dependent epimerase/dehydratase family
VEGPAWRIVVIGGTGLIGSKVVARLAEHGHEAIAASPKSGVNTLTCDGVAEVLSGAQVVVGVSNSPSEDFPVLSAGPTPSIDLEDWELSITNDGSSTTLPAWSSAVPPATRSCCGWCAAQAGPGWICAA